MGALKENTVLFSFFDISSYVFLYFVTFLDYLVLLLLCSKNVSREYELFMLQEGEFDERMFLSETAETELGTPTKSLRCTS